MVSEYSCIWGKEKKKSVGWGMNEQAMSDITEEKGILHCQKDYKYATLKKKNKTQSYRPSTVWVMAPV